MTLSKNATTKQYRPIMTIQMMCDYVRYEAKVVPAQSRRSPVRRTKTNWILDLRDVSAAVVRDVLEDFAEISERVAAITSTDALVPPANMVKCPQEINSDTLCRQHANTSSTVLSSLLFPQGTSK